MSCAPIRNMLTDARDSRRDPEVNAQRARPDRSGTGTSPRASWGSPRVRGTAKSGIGSRYPKEPRGQSLADLGEPMGTLRVSYALRTFNPRPLHGATVNYRLV